MYFKQLNSQQLTSILLAKDCPLPWRGQPDVCFMISYDAWKAFASAHKHLERAPYIYYNMVDNDSISENAKMRMYYLDLTWAQYCELRVSGTNSTLITTSEIPFSDVIHEGALNFGTAGSALDRMNSIHSEFCRRNVIPMITERITEPFETQAMYNLVYLRNKVDSLKEESK